MRLTWASFKWTEFLKQLLWTAWGGFVVTLGVFAYSHFFGHLPHAGAAMSAYEELVRSVLAPNGVVLLGVLFLFLAYLVLTGAPLIDWLARAVIRPAIDFCKDASSVATGVVAAFIFMGGTIQGALVFLEKAGIFAFTACLLHGMKNLIDFYTSVINSPVGPVTPTTLRVSVSLSAAIALALVYWTL